MVWPAWSLLIPQPLHPLPPRAKLQREASRFPAAAAFGMACVAPARLGAKTRRAENPKRVCWSDNRLTGARILVLATRLVCPLSYWLLLRLACLLGFLFFFSFFLVTSFAFCFFLSSLFNLLS